MNHRRLTFEAFLLVALHFCGCSESPSSSRGDAAATDSAGAADVTDPDGAAVDPDGAAVQPDDAAVDPDGAAVQPDGAAVDGQSGSVTVTDDVTDEGRACIRIETPSATYFYDKQGAGFTSLVDKDGNDWISWKPGGGSAGEYRGIPNLGHCCHPGYSGATSTIVSQQAAYAKVESSGTATDGKQWRVTWEFLPDHATLTIIDAPTSYYMLYEGTPGGAVGAEDYFVFSAGMSTKTELSVGGDPITTDLPAPEWIYFADDTLQRALLVMHHEDDAIAERYWTMNSEMTVFGFGRTDHGASMGLSAAPQRMSIALLEAIDFQQAQSVAAAIMP